MTVNQENNRRLVSSLVLSGVALVGLIAHEGFTDKAVIPTTGDRPTVGFGSTFREDGSPVRMGDTITPQRALARTLAHVAKDENGLRRCVVAPLHQREYDLLVDFSYQYGVTAACGSSIVRKLNVGDYTGACQAYIEYRYMTSDVPHPGWEKIGPRRWRFDCATPGNRQCMGVWTRQLKRYTDCMGVQS